MILEVIYTAVAGLLVYGLVNYIIQLLQLGKYPPGPIPLPVIGNLHLLGSHPPKALMAMAEKYGDVMSITLGTQRIVVLSNIEAAREALIKKGEDFAGRPQDVHSAWLISRGYNDIAFADYGPAWKLMRKVVHGSMKMYGSGLEDLGKSVLSEAQELSNSFDKQAGNPFNPHNDIALCVLNVICTIIFGSRYDVKDKEFLKVVQFSQDIVKGFDNASVTTFIPWLRFFPNTGLDKLKKGIKARDELLADKLEQHRRDFDPENLGDFTDALIDEFSKEESQDKSVRKYLTDAHLEMILSDLFLAGAETTTTTILWCMAYLVTWPEVQTKIAEERKRILGDRPPNVKDRGQLPYFEATIQETMRFSSLAPLGLPHKTTRDTTIDNLKIPKGTQIWFNHWALHHDKRHWDEPDSFKPERWLDEEGKLVPGTKQSYLPFGAGRRVCIGESLAKMELFLFLSSILHRYEIEKAPDGSLPDLEGVLSVTLSPKPFQVMLKKRVSS